MFPVEISVDDPPIRAINTGHATQHTGKLLPLLESPPGDFDGLGELVLVGRAPDFDAIKSKVREYAEG
jgi:hypothetical protein